MVTVGCYNLQNCVDTYAYRSSSQLPHWIVVGASLLAKNAQAPRLFRQRALSLTFFASKLAPTQSAPAVVTAPAYPGRCPGWDGR
ncbi:hypothetical protein DBR14_17225 [Pseudomonas sp. HMWF034]|nr:hypothetical protein DBR14_17225 [Pseudomonas sp. HMWF034]